MIFQSFQEIIKNLTIEEINQLDFQYLKKSFYQNLNQKSKFFFHKEFEYFFNSLTPSKVKDNAFRFNAFKKYTQKLGFYGDFGYQHLPEEIIFSILLSNYPQAAMTENMLSSIFDHVNLYNNQSLQYDDIEKTKTIIVIIHDFLNHKNIHHEPRFLKNDILIEFNEKYRVDLKNHWEQTKVFSREIQSLKINFNQFIEKRNQVILQNVKHRNFLKEENIAFINDYRILFKFLNETSNLFDENLTQNILKNKLPENDCFNIYEFAFSNILKHYLHTSNINPYMIESNNIENHHINNYVDFFMLNYELADIYKQKNIKEFILATDIISFEMIDKMFTQDRKKTIKL